MPDQILEHDFDGYFLKFRNQTVQYAIQERVIQGTLPCGGVQPILTLNSVLHAGHMLSWSLKYYYIVYTNDESWNSVLYFLIDQ